MEVPVISFIENGKPIFRITDTLAQSYFWGINCATFGFNPEEIIATSFEVRKNKKAVKVFYQGFLNGHHSDVFKSLISS